MAQTKPPDEKSFDQIGQRVFQERKTPGFAFLVWSHGSVVFAKGYGFADMAAKTQVSPETRFAIGSITKQFTAACILMLMEQGKLALDDKLSKYLPGMPNADKVTLRMLLNQDSGLHNYPNTTEHDWPIQGTIPPEKILAILKTDKPDFAPGERWEYSNTNYTLLAAIVARVSGISYGEFLTRNIFAPLGMAESGSGFAAQAGIATPYEGSNGVFSPAKPKISLDLFYGAGGIVSTVQDLARWDAALVSGRLLTADSRHLLWTNGTLPGGQPMNYAMGFIATSAGGHRELWHNGYAPKAGGYCFNAIYPDDELAVAVLSNAAVQSFGGEPEKMAREVLALYDPRLSEVAADQPWAELKDDPAVNALARKIFAQFIAGRPDRSLLTAEMSAALTPALLAQVAPQLQGLGALQDLKLVEKEPMGGGTRYLYAAGFTSGTHKISMFLAADGKVGGYRVIP